MALFKPYKITSDKLADLPVREGQIVITTDTKKLYVDVSATERIEVTSDAEVDLTDYVTTSTLTSTVGEEASARQKQDQLLEQSIDDKLGADDIVAGSNVQISHDDESGHITISATDTKYSAGTGLGMIGNGFYLLNGGVGLNQLANDSVSEDKLVDGAVDTAKIADGAVTADKLAEGVIPEIPDVTLASLGVTATAEELNYVDGVTSNIQAQLNDKAAITHNHAASAITSGTFSLDRIPTITDAKISGLSASKLTGTIPTANLPSYVDDVVEGETTADFPETGEAGKIYVATSTNKTYRWSGSGYVEISASLALGTTSSTAFRGDYGNTAYQHATAKGSAFASGLYKITTNAQGHVTAATAVTKNDITALGIPAQDTNTNTTYTLSKSGSTITLSGSDGSSTSVTDANTTYSLGSFGITATAAELNKLDGVTATATELNYVDGVTSNIQTQLNGKAASSHSHSVASTSAAGFLPKLGGGTTNYLRADGTWAKPPDTNTTYTLSSFGITATAAELNKLDGVTTTATQLNYLNTLTGNVQTQLNGKAASSHSHDGTYTRIYNLGIQAFGGNQNGITTAQFLTLLNGYGAFSDKSWITRGSWSYASNQYIKDTGCGNIHLAGCTVEVMGTSTTNCTIRIHTPTTSSSGVSNGDFIYINNGPEYTPGWRRLYSTKYKPTAADIGAAASSHTHSYLPLSGGTLTGTLTARTITPSADSTYNIGSSTVRYANIYADTFTGALSGNATSATSAAYWTTARTLSFTGDVTGSVSVRGNANMSCALTIGSGKVGTTELATDAVTSAKIAANAVTASEIASGAVGLSELSSAVGTVAVQSATPTDSHVKLWIKV